MSSRTQSSGYDPNDPIGIATTLQKKRRSARKFLPTTNEDRELNSQNSYRNSELSNERENNNNDLKDIWGNQPTR